MGGDLRLPRVHLPHGWNDPTFPPRIPWSLGRSPDSGAFSQRDAVSSGMRHGPFAAGPVVTLRPSLTGPPCPPPVMPILIT